MSTKFSDIPTSGTPPQPTDTVMGVTVGNQDVRWPASDFSGGATGANPTATAGPSAVNGVATTFMRSDGAPAVQVGSAAQQGIVQVDGSTITASAGVISAVQQSIPTGANPTATAKDTAVNGVATTFMRSDGAPAVQKASASQFGIVEVDGSTITATGGVISAVQQTIPTGANPTATAGPAAVNGSAATFMRSDGAPAVQLATTLQKGLVQADGTTITVAAGVISAVQPAGANPTATAKDTAVNGSAATFMRSDAAPAVQKASNTQFGIVEVDGTTITAASGVISAVQPVTSVSNSDGSLTISPTSGAVVASLNTAHANTWSANQTMADSTNIPVGATTGTIIATATTQKLGFYAATPVVRQTAPSAAPVSVITTASTTTSLAAGFATTTQANNLTATVAALVTEVNSLRSDLIALGLIG